MDKPCIKCGEVKALSDFSPNSKMRDGRLNTCKACKNADQRQRRRANPRPKTDKTGVTHAHRGKWRQGNWEKHLAHNQLYKAITRGKMVRPSACSRCSKEGPVHGHHEDYSRPLEVEWLCQQCHGEVHSEKRGTLVPTRNPPSMR